MRTPLGVGITTHDRPSTLAVTLQHIRQFTAPYAKIVVVDDASQARERQATFRFDRNVGIARAKNKCLELLDDCEDIFLFDDDCYPIAEQWWQPYLDSPEPHLCYTFLDLAGPRKMHDVHEVYRDDRHVAFTASRGCMYYLNHRVLDVVGGYDPAYGLWGYEHGAYSNRIHSAGLTSWRFADVVDSSKLFHSMDEYEEVPTGRSVPLNVRQRLVKSNVVRYRDDWDSDRYIDYREQHDLVLTCYFTSQIDPQRGKRAPADPGLLDPLLHSLRGHHVVVLHDGLHVQDSGLVHWEYVAPSTLNAYEQRNLAYYNYLRAHPEVRNVWVVDGTDVVMLRDPFPHMQPGKLYIGSETTILGCDWTVKHSRSADMVALLAEFGSQTLLNCGLIGGERELLMRFFHRVYSKLTDNLRARALGIERNLTGLGDMGAVNLVAWREFADRLVYGPQINTIFKAFERNNTVAWWRHK